MKLFSVLSKNVVFAVVILLCALHSYNLFAQQQSQISIPNPLKVDPKYIKVASLYAVGTQNYQAVSDTSHAGQLKWQFVEPVANLYDSIGNLVALHTKGPVWKCLKDSSSVTGKLVAKAASPAPDQNIDWLLLSGIPHGENGLLSGVVNIQRINTHGGVAPATRPAAGDEGMVAKVPYSATYVFYRKG